MNKEVKKQKVAIHRIDKTFDYARQVNNIIANIDERRYYTTVQVINVSLSCIDDEPYVTILYQWH